ncbi:MAG: sigma-70 family RNA polymerase sigma factor [Deltaproteobacteria bacterium]|nr:sigma-70 family RNA polymerase sigma factor [Deltaproteobacteria bacterium]
MGEEDELDTWVVAAAAGDAGAWQKLWSAVEPSLSRTVAQPRFLGRLGQREEDRRNIVVAVMARLRADGFHRLQLYLEAKHQNPRLRFIGWLRVVAKRVGIDYLRGHQDYLRRHDKDPSTPGQWVDAGTLPPDSQLVGERPPVTNRGTAHTMLEFADGAMPPQQRRALELWTRSESFADISTSLGLAGADEAEKMVRAAVERLRRRFREEGDE